MRTQHHRLMGFVAFLATVLALFAPMARPAFAIGGAVVVKSLADTDLANQDNCTLREALQGISLYHASPNDGTKATYHECTGIHPSLNAITFSVSGTIKPASSLPDVSSNIALTGPIIIDGSANPNSPIFRVSTSDAIFSIAGITVTKAEPAILMTSGQAMLNIAGSSFVGNTAITNGGAIDAAGKVNIAGTNFTGNTAPKGDGGAINMTGGDSQLNIGGSVFNGNVAQHGGGAIMMSTPGNIVDTIFNGNIAQGLDPDGSGTDGDPNDEDRYFQMGGGALHITNTSGHDGKVEIIRSVFNGNLAAPKANAGALYTESGAVIEVRDSSFNGNLSGSTGFDRLGGAVLNVGATLSMNRVTLLNNGVTGDGGGIAIDRGNIPVNLTNVTIVANAATGKGGGIYAFNTQQNGSSNIRTDLTIRNATISLNVSTDGGGIYGMAPSGSHPEPHKLANTILADNVPANCAGGPFTTLGHNLDSAASCALTGAGDQQGANAALEGPFFNGGPLANLLTQKLGPGSAALDGGDPAICAADPVGNIDQRSEPRGGDGNGDGTGGCDIGAYEGGTVKAGYASIPVQPGPIDVGNVQLGTTGQTSFSIINTGNKDLEVSAQLQGAGAGEFGIVTFPGTVSTQAIATISCTPTGNPGARTAGLVVTTNDPDHPTVAYELQCNATAVPVAGYGSTPAAPGPLSIGPVLVGQSKSTTLTIMETGNATLEANTPVLGGLNPGEFSAAVNVTIADGGAAVPVQVTCAPTAPGIRSATLTFNTSDPTQPAVTYNLTCSATVPPNPVLADPTAFDGLGINTMTGPYGEALSPDGRHLYVASTNGVVTVFERNTETGSLGNPIQSFTDPNGFLAGAIRVIVSPNGANVYVAAPASNRILAYSRDTNSGLLTALDNVVEGEDYGCVPPPCTGPVYGLQNAYGMAISPDNRYLYVSGISNTGVGGDNKTIVTFNLLGDGGLQNIFNDPTVAGFTTQADLVGTYDLTLSPDGAHLYAANYGNPNSIVVFSRNPSTGALSYAQTLSEATTASLNGVFRIAFSPDGQYAYTSSYDGNAITVLKRNAADGKLSFVAAYVDGGQDDLGQVTDALAESSSAVVSPDGRYLFTTSHADNALNIFERNQETGRLVFVEKVVRNPATSSPPLGQARDVVIADNGRHIYVSGYSDNRIVFLPFANPLPTLTSLSPASTLAGSGPTVVTVNGNDFVESSVAIWNNAIILDDEFVSSSEIRVTLPADLLATPGSGTITVINLGPGGGTSNGLSFTIGAPATSTTPADNPVPSIEQIGPQGAVAGGPSLLVTVNGSGFLPSSVVNWNGEARQTTYISGSTLQFQTIIADVAQPGTSAVTVVNPAPGGGTSNAVGFTVAAPGENPPPSLDRISPASLVDGEGGGLLVINVYGAGFVEGAVVRWDGEDRPTTFVSDTELRLEVNGADVAGAGQRSVTVFNPAPGGGESNAVAFTVVAIGENPLPTLGAAQFQSFNTDGSVNLTVTGAGFVAGTQMRWNGADRTTSVTSATQLVVTISAADYAAGSAVLTAQNPAPGGGASNELLFSLTRLALPLVMR